MTTFHLNRLGLLKWRNSYIDVDLAICHDRIVNVDRAPDYWIEAFIRPQGPIELDKMRALFDAKAVGHDWRTASLRFVFHVIGYCGELLGDYHQIYIGGNCFCMTGVPKIQYL